MKKSSPSPTTMCAWPTGHCTNNRCSDLPTIGVGWRVRLRTRSSGMQSEKKHLHISKGGHELPRPRVSQGPALPYTSKPCGRPPLKRPYGCFRGDCPQSRWPAAIFYPLGYPLLYASGRFAWSYFMGHPRGSRIKYTETNLKGPNISFFIVRILLLDGLLQ
jgi:hypothetical protein